MVAWGMFGAVLYLRLLGPPVLSSIPLLAILERYVETVLKLTGSFSSCS